MKFFDLLLGIPPLTIIVHEHTCVFVCVVPFAEFLDTLDP